MSTSWGFRCRTHEVESEHWQVPPRVLVQLVYWTRGTPPMPEPLSGWASVEVLGAYGSPTEWLDEHRDCRLDLVNEYRDASPLGAGRLALDGSVGVDTPEVEEVRQGAKVAQEWVPAAQVQPGALGAQ